MNNNTKSRFKHRADGLSEQARKEAFRAMPRKSKQAKVGQPTREK